jgi:hypothetical protein
MEDWKPNYDGKKQYKKKNRYKQEDGDVVFRILPQPKGKNAKRSGDWSKYHSVQFGYKNSEGKARPFESPQVKKDKVVLVADAALDRINDLKAKLEVARSENNGPLIAKLNTLIGFKGVYSVDNNHHMNVIGLDNNIGGLKIRYKAKLALDEEIKKLRAQGIDPLSLEDGRFFVFTRTGTSNDTAFKVSVYTESLDVPGIGKVDRQVVHKVTPEILLRLEEEGFDLDDIAPKLTAEEVAKIVATSDLLTGRSPACDEFFDARWKARRALATALVDETLQSSGDDEEEYRAPSAQPTGLAMPVTAPVTISNPPSAQPTGLTTPNVSQIGTGEDMSDEDFFKEIGNTGT